MPLARRRYLAVLAVLAGVSLFSPSLVAGRTAGASRTGLDEGSDRPAPMRLGVGPVWEISGGLSLGRGLRFNNPYRLGTELGDDAESLSLTAMYADVALGVALAGTGPWSHGVALHSSFALEGVPQEVLAPSYVSSYRLDAHVALRARAGLPIVIEPDMNLGLEMALGGILSATAGVGVTADLVGSLFYGASTLESSPSAIPILSMEVGLVYAYEVLP